VDDDFPRLVSLACHDLRTPLATVSGFAKTMLRIEELEPDKQARYLGLIDNSADELASLLDLLSLAARIEGGRYEPVLREVDSFSLAPEGATGTGATVLVDPEPVERALAAFQRAAARHGGVDVTVAVDGRHVSFEPVTEEAAPVVPGDSAKDLGAAVAARLVRSLGGGIALDAERLTVTLPS
jgi:signal transduction histidine kinase